MKEEKNIKIMTMLRDYFKQEAEYVRQYGPKTLFFIQCGTFFEVYGLKKKNSHFINDRITALSRLTGMSIAAKKTTKGIATYQGYQVYMCGFSPIDRLDKWVNVLNSKDYTVAVHTQDKNIPSIRKELGIYSPGTNFNNGAGEITNNIMVLWIEKNNQLLLHKVPMIICGMACLDIFTGMAYTFEYKEHYFHNPTTFDEIERFYSSYQPTELVVIHNIEDNTIDDILQFSSIHGIMIHKIYSEDKEHAFYKQVKKCEKQIYQQELMKQFYPITDMDQFFKSLQLWDYPLATQAFCFLLNFIYTHNPYLTKKIKEPIFTNVTNRLILANHSLKQLHIMDRKGHRGRLSSVLSFVNRCKTSMGKRKLMYHLLNPTTDIQWLHKEYQIVQYIKDHYEKWLFLRPLFKQMADIEKLYRKIILGRLAPSELAIFVSNLKTIIDIDRHIQQDETLQTYINIKFLSKTCTTLINIIQEKIILKKAALISTHCLDTNIFKRGQYATLDEMQEAYIDSLDQIDAIRNLLANIVIQYDKKAIKKNIIKIHKTDKSGMFLVMTSRRSRFLKERIQKRSNAREIIHYISSYNKQKKSINFDLKSLTFSKGPSSNVRLDNSLLTKLYTTIFQQSSNLKEILQGLYSSFIQSLQNYNKEIEIIIQYIATLDWVVTRAHISKKFNYSCPVIHEEAEKSFVNATQIRHILIEHLQQHEIYVPNDISLGTASKHDGILLYGTNAVGKSSLIRSLGICIVLAQGGFFVPCDTFIYKPYTALFTRILGNDDIFKGLSTFAVEMSELSIILKMADQNSLILGDELCSGTETSSAISIFAAGVIQLHQRRASFIFATHFHELVELSAIQNCSALILQHMTVRYNPQKDQLVYDRILKSGHGESMYGLEVCKALSMPADFLQLAHTIRRNRKPIQTSILEKEECSYNRKKIKGNCELCGKLGIDIHHLQPQVEADGNGFINHFHKNHAANLSNICKICHDKITKQGIKHRRVKTSDGVKLSTI